MSRAVVVRSAGNVGRDWRAFDFGALPSFSKRQAAAWNAVRRLTGSETRWQTWIAEGLAQMLETSAGFEIRLRQRHTVHTDQRETTFTSSTGTLTLGREETCDVRLPQRSVGNLHARIFTRDGSCYIEDLASCLGTFLNDSRLLPNQPALISTGDEFAIFPYVFTVEVTERWMRGGQVDVHAGPVLPLNPRPVDRPAARNRAAFTIEIHPPGAPLLLEADRGFLEDLSAQTLGPLGANLAENLSFTTADTGLFELLLAAVLERANRDLPFPLHASLGLCGPRQTQRNSEAGLAFSFSVRIACLTGTFRLLIGDEAMASLADSGPTTAENPALLQVSWTFPISAGYAELTSAETAIVEPGDVVVLVREFAILFPHEPEKGWRIRQRPDNISQTTIDKYFESGCLSRMENQPESGANGGATPDLAGLPVRVHAIVGEKEMTLAEANLMVAGAIVELDGAKSDPVRIALNGKIAGFGELVEVSGKLGLRILSWKAPAA
jgi:flagellar motor switch/type III secretory pathway protein FliN/pSer/pThr/pTyr-binding forkhead associated (FHA) protein